MTLPRLVLVAVVAASACSTSPLDDLRPERMFAGTVPQSVVMTECASGPVAVVAASTDARVNIIDVERGDSTSLVLPDGSNPWDVAVIATAEGPRGIVSLFNDDAVALFDPCSEAPVVLQTLGDESPLAVDDDADIDEMLPANPQAVAVGDDDDGIAIYVAWTNIIALARGDEPMRTGPGLLTRLRLVAGRLVIDGGLVLPCKNPAAIAVDGDSVVVACSGVFKYGDGFERAGVGGLVVVDSDSFTIAAAVDVEASPAAVIVHRGEIVVGDALDGTVTRYDNNLVEQQRTQAAAEVATVFAFDVIDGVLVVAHFEDRLVADPFGQARETSILDGTTFRGIVDIVHDERDIFALLSTSGELVRIDRDTVVGGLQ